MDRQMQSSGTVIIRFWQRIPVVIRAIIVGIFVFEIGVVAWVVIVGPLVPAPWSILVMGGVPWLYWKYFSGNWWPKTTAEFRRKRYRDVKLSASVWKWGILATIFFVIVIQSGLVITFRIIEFPAEAFTAEYPFDELPTGLAWLFIVMSSLVAGICEETGFRGYMQVPLEKRYGPAVAITVVSNNVPHDTSPSGLGCANSLSCLCHKCIVGDSCLCLWFPDTQYDRSHGDGYI